MSTAGISSRDAILDSAGKLFGERGYRGVTVRDIASDAGVSAALVMKLYGSKEKLFAATKPDESLLSDLDVPAAELGATLVFRVLMRRERGLKEPWAMLPFTIQDSPTPDAARLETRERYLASMAGLLERHDAGPPVRFHGGGADDRLWRGSAHPRHVRRLGLR